MNKPHIGQIQQMAVADLTYTKVRFLIPFLPWFYFDERLIWTIAACSEQGAYQVASKSGHSLISRVLQIDYTYVRSGYYWRCADNECSQEWCNWAFPHGKHNRIPHTPDLSRYNSFGGWDVRAYRLAHIDGSKLILINFRKILILTVIKVPTYGLIFATTRSLPLLAIHQTCTQSI